MSPLTVLRTVRHHEIFILFQMSCVRARVPCLVCGTCVSVSCVCVRVMRVCLCVWCELPDGMHVCRWFYSVRQRKFKMRKTVWCPNLCVWPVFVVCRVSSRVCVVCVSRVRCRVCVCLCRFTEGNRQILVNLVEFNIPIQKTKLHKFDRIFFFPPFPFAFLHSGTLMTPVTQTKF